jgi:hypothetical protein
LYKRKDIIRFRVPSINQYKREFDRKFNMNVLYDEMGRLCKLWRSFVLGMDCGGICICKHLAEDMRKVMTDAVTSTHAWKMNIILFKN